MRIGIDFDNTIIDYDRVFLEAARHQRLVSEDFTGSKRAVRDAIRMLPDGEFAWQRLQGYVYGAGIRNAVPFDGFDRCLRRCHARDLPVFIVSHKTRYGHYDAARIDLREAALDWMAGQGFLSGEVRGLCVERIFFEDDRAKKLQRIAGLACNCFIDDLEEVFADPGFPSGVNRILFGQAGSSFCDLHCSTWVEITAAVFGDDD